MSVLNTVAPESPFGLARALKKVRKPNRKQGSEANAASPVELSQVQSNLQSTNSARQEELERWPLPGLAPMTRVRTSFGDVHAIALRKGDEVLTRSGAYKPILWINRIMLDEHVLTLKPDSNPIVVAPGALGAGAPAHEIMVSPRQIVSADERSGLSSSREAAMLISRPGVRRLQETGLSYTMLHVGEAADILCDGLYLHFPIDT